ncbi:MAG: hypothetical protein ABW360_15170 [Phenylobacterium sp.]
MTKTELTPPGYADAAELARLAVITRHAVVFAIEFIDIVRDNGHILDTLLASAIIQANVQPIQRDGDLFMAFAKSDAVPPDTLRRPVSMNALANSLGLPFETVRRRVNAMVPTGWCRIVEEGVIVPAETLDTPKHYAQAFQGFQRLQAFYYALSELGLLRDLPPPSVDLGANPFPIRACTRLLGAYMLRAIEGVGALGALMDGLILLAMFRNNVEGLPTDAIVAAPPGAPDGMADDLRRPVSVATLGAQLGIPPETIRRHVTVLIERGYCVRVRGGLIVPGHILAHPLLWAGAARNAGNLQRLFVALAQLGVLRAWDGVRPPR